VNADTNDASELIDLASEALGALTLFASDEFFAPKERLIHAAAPIWREGEYTDRGKWMDGWETRRRRDLLPGEPGFDVAHDDCVVKLGAPGVIRAIDVETTHFKGNFPESCSLDVCVMPGATIALWGLAFKPETDDLREAPSLEVIRDLLARGAVLRAYDPVAMAATQALFPSITYCADPYEAAMGADAVALITDWNEFKGVDLERVRAGMCRPVLLDGRNLYDPHEIAALGFTYCGVGVPSPPAAPVFNPAMMQSVAD
jgi:hypothetical protein